MSAGSVKLEKRCNLACSWDSKEALVPPYSFHGGSTAFGRCSHMNITLFLVVLVLSSQIKKMKTTKTVHFLKMAHLRCFRV
jgi:hypothetical protein